MSGDTTRLQQQAMENSARWFPELHERPVESQLIHQVLGLVGEAGELANLVKKANRAAAFQSVATADWHQAVADELADVFTYTMNVASLLGVDLAAAFQRKQAICEERWGTP